MIYLILSGRAGNQLFMYAAAEEVRKQFGGNDVIIPDSQMRIIRNTLMESADSTYYSGIIWILYCRKIIRRSLRLKRSAAASLIIMV